MRVGLTSGRLLLRRVGKLLVVAFDHESIVGAVLCGEFLRDLRLQLTGQFAPGLAGVLLQLGIEVADVGLAAALRHAELAVWRLVGGIVRLAVLRILRIALTLLLAELLGQLLE